MKKELKQQIEKIDERLELEKYEKLREIQLEQDIENHKSNLSRSRSITVGTAFGGTTEIIMRSDGGRMTWCNMQPVEVVELIHQLAANVGCNIVVKPRNDFSSWRDWRVSEAEKKHLNGHVPFVNDMAVYQQLGASGYNDAEAKKLMDFLANVKEYANENLPERQKKSGKELQNGENNVVISEESGLIVNKLAINEKGEIVYVAGGSGGDGKKVLEEDLARMEELEKQEELNGKNTVATKKNINKRTIKRPTRTS